MRGGWWKTIHISQGSVTTCLRRGGIFKHEFVAIFFILLRSPSVKKSLKTGQYLVKLSARVIGVLFFDSV